MIQSSINENVYFYQKINYENKKATVTFFSIPSILFAHENDTLYNASMRSFKQNQGVQSIQPQIDTPYYRPTFESLEKVNPVPEWFKDAKFGIYFH